MVVAELGQPVQAAIEFTAVLVEERLELGAGWLIDDILSGRRWKGGHKRSIQERRPRGKYRSSAWWVLVTGSSWLRLRR